MRTRPIAAALARGAATTLTALSIAVSPAAAQPAGDAGRAPDSRLPALSIAVLAPPPVTDALLSRLSDEASAIWRSSGVAFRWNRAAGAADAALSLLEVHIDSHAPARLEDREALGWIAFSSGVPERTIHLSLAQAERLLSVSAPPEASTRAGHDTLLGRALGRALAHELGHYFERSEAHTRGGLMRPAWTADLLFARSRTPFETTDVERRAASRSLD